MKFATATHATLAAVLASAWMVMGLAAQEASPDSSPTDGLVHRLEGHELPRYHLVRNFLQIAYSLYYGDDASQSFFLTSVGIKSGTAAEQALARALTRVHDLEFGEAGAETILHSTNSTTLSGRPIRDDLGGPQSEGYEERLASAELERATELGEVYGNLIKELEDAGSSIDGLVRYMDEQIAPGTSMASSEPLDSTSTIWAEAAAFDSAVQR